MEIKNSGDLKAAILKLEDKEQHQKQQVVENFTNLKESLKPINLVKSTFNKVRESPGITGTIVKAALGMGVGMVSKRFLLGKSPGFVRKIVGSAVQMGLAGLVAKKSDTITEGSNNLLKNIFRSRKKKTAR